MLSEFLAVRGRALAGREAGGAAGHWSVETARERGMEVAGRMQVPEAEQPALWAALGLPGGSAWGSSGRRASASV